MSRVLSVFLVILTMVMLLPGRAAAAGVDAPVVTASNVADSGKIRLTWEAVEGAVKYEIYRATSKNGTYSRRSTTTRTTVTNTNAEAGKTYYYKVRAIDAKGGYADSKIVSRACDLPRPVVKIANAASSGYPKLTWEAVEGAVKYQVYRATSKNGEYILTKTTTGTTYTHTSAKVGNTYYYKVVAVAEKSAANSASSAVKSRVCDLPSPVVKITNVASTGYPRLTWEAVEGAVKYQVYRAASRDGEYTLIKTTTGTAYTHTSAKVGKAYYYKVMAVAEKSAANSAYSSVKSRTCDLARPVVKITNVASTGYPRLTWEAVEGAVKYQVYRAASKDGEYILTKTVTGTSYTNTAAKAGRTYYYKVQAVAQTSAANSAYSSVQSRTCDLARPKVTAALNDSGQPILTWEAVSGATAYKVYRANAEKGTYALISTISDTVCTDTTAKGGSTYYYKVRACCGNSSATSAYSTVRSVQATEAGQASKLVYVNLPSVYVYKSRTSSSESLKLYYMTELKLGKIYTTTSGKWYQVYYKGAPYYMWITANSDKLTTIKSTGDYEVKTQIQKEIRDLALEIDREWDTKYVSGETGDVHKDGSVGFDCSGFVTYVINTVMQKHNPIYRLTPALQEMYKLDVLCNKGLTGEIRAVDVELKDAQAGDVLFFKSTSSSALVHCGLYMGNGEFIHCTSTWDQGVGLQTLNGKYGDRLIGIKRFIPEEVKPANATFYVTQGNTLYNDRQCTDRTQVKLKRGEEVTVLYTFYKTNGDPITAYIRTKDGTYGFVWLKYLSMNK